MSDGTTDYFYRSHATAGLLNITGLQPFSLVFKIRRDSYAYGMYLFVKSNQFYLTILATGTSRFVIYPGPLSTTGGHVAVAGEWVAVAAVYDLNTIRVYNNGILYESSTNPLPAKNVSINSSTGTFILGNTSATAGYHYIDYAAIYRRALTWEEIAFINSYW